MPRPIIRSKAHLHACDRLSLRAVRRRPSSWFLVETAASKSISLIGNAMATGRKGTSAGHRWRVVLVDRRGKQCSVIKAMNASVSALSAFRMPETSAMAPTAAPMRRVAAELGDVGLARLVADHPDAAEAFETRARIFQREMHRLRRICWRLFALRPPPPEERRRQIADACRLMSLTKLLGKIRADGRHADMHGMTAGRGKDLLREDLTHGRIVKTGQTERSRRQRRPDVVERLRANATIASTAAGERFHTRTLRPDARRCGTMADPICPRPITEIDMIFSLLPKQ